MTDTDPVATIEALPYGQRPVAALEDAFLSFCSALDTLSLDRVRARLRGCQALSKGWDAAVEAMRPAKPVKRRSPAEKWIDELRRGEEGKPVATPRNVGLILRHWPPFESLRLNELTLEAEIDGEPMRDGDSFRWQERIEKEFEVNFSKDTIDAGIEAVAEERAYHPFKEKLDALPAWDGNSRFDEFARDVLGSADPMAARYIECALIGAVARTYTPGRKVDTILTLFSRKHGTKKTETLSALFYQLVFIGNIKLEDKDTIMCAATSVCTILDEVDEFMGRDVWLSMKRWASQKFDTFRAPYGRRPRKWQRRFIICATTNRDDILRDETGHRRWLIVSVSEDDKSVAERIPKLLAMLDQLWAEAKAKWIVGTNGGRDEPKDFLWWLSPDEERAREEGAKAFERRTVIDDKVEFYIAQQLPGAELRMQEILINGLDIDRDKVAKEQGLERQVGAVLRRLGYASGHNANNVRVWRKK